MISMSETRLSLERLLGDFRAYFEAGKRLERSSNGYADALSLYERADEIAFEATRLYPKSEQTYFHRGLALEALGDFEESYYCFSRTIAINPRDAKFFIKRGDVSVALGDFENAVNDYKTSLKISFRYTSNKLKRRGIYILVPVNEDPDLFKHIDIEDLDSSWWHIPIM